ncbi:anti-sigma factor [Rhizobium sp. TRM95111]|uniref:anti-sigma factor family protein n=1 Tax=Rhizobium alarense TaxID=2846851 RepID=UPI001F4139D1|nr:anti-sigma factor [Rhizobium alarense]MCF3642100.1 anti-sigma factor [Rhizobium alarense]
MSEPRLDDEMLMAFADGELDDDAMAKVEEAMAADPAIAERVALFMESRTVAADHLKPLADEPVPDALLAAVRDMAARAAREAPARSAPSADNVLTFPKRQAQRAFSGTSAYRWGMGLAASLAILLAGAGGYLLGGLAGEAGTPTELAVLGDPVLRTALDTLPSGSEVTLSGDAGAARLVSSFRDKAGALCREFELKRATGGNTVSIACRTGEAWRTHLVVSLPGGEGGYAPASSVAAVDAWIEATEAGSPLAAEEEKTALATLGQ